MRDQTEIQHFAQTELLKVWIDSSFFEIPIIGVKLHISDAPFILSIVLTLIVIWLFESTRRDNLLVGRILYLISKESKDIRKYVYCGISFISVFSTMLYREGKIIKHTREKRNRLISIIFYLPFILIITIMVFDHSCPVVLKKIDGNA